MKELISYLTDELNKKVLSLPQSLKLKTIKWLEESEDPDGATPDLDYYLDYKFPNKWKKTIHDIMLLEHHVKKLCNMERLISQLYNDVHN